MKVLFIVTAYKRDPDDVITPWMTELILNLRKRGVEVDVFAPAYRGLGDQVVDGVRVWRFRYFPARWERLTHEQAAPDRVEAGLFYKALVPFYIAGGILRIIGLTRRERYDVLQAHWPLPNFLFAHVGRWASGARAISSFHGVEVRWVRNRLPALTGFLRWVIRRSDGISANTETTAAEIRSIRPAPVEVIPYSLGFDPGEAPPAGTGEGAVPPGEAGFRVLFVGRLVERKGVEVLLRALERVAQTREVRATIVGDGPERETLMQLAGSLRLADRVHFAGFVDEPTLLRCFRECSVFVLPAVYDRRGDTEGQGVVIVEAMSFRKPVVASRVGGIRDIVRDGETGILVEERNEEELSRALIRLLDAPDLARRMGEAGFRDYRARFSWEAVVGRWCALYGTVTGLEMERGGGGPGTRTGRRASVEGSASRGAGAGPGS